MHLTRSAALVLAAVAFNIALGHLVRDVLDWPLYLDSVGTVLAGALLGPLAGAAVGALTNVAWGLLLGSQTALAFALTAAFIGWAAGYAVSRGAFERLGTVLWSGLLVGVSAALISAPISAYVFGNITGLSSRGWPGGRCGRFSCRRPAWERGLSSRCGDTASQWQRSCLPRCCASFFCPHSAAASLRSFISQC